MQVMSCIAVSAVVYLVRLEYLMYGAGHLGYLCKEIIPLLIGQVNELADMLPMRQNNPSLLALLLKYIEKACLHLTHRITELSHQFALHTICAIRILYHIFHVPVLLYVYSYQLKHTTEQVEFQFQYLFFLS